MNQAAINALLVRYSREGLRGVRLKGGAPCIFGYGGEEMAAMREAGMAVEVVPGVMASVAVTPGIPFTHRGVSRGLHVITAQGAENRLRNHEWQALAQVGGTLAVYMGVRMLPKLDARLARAGLPLSTPVVAVENSTLPGQRAIPGGLGCIAGRVAGIAPEGPTLLLIGEAVAPGHRRCAEEELLDAA